MKHSIEELRQWQSLSLNVKILMTKARIREWIKTYGEDGCYISFSGGKDSTVLLDLVRQDYPDVPALFVDVPTQYPELKEFATSFENVDVVRPKITFLQVCEKYGFPLISKEVSECVYGAKKYLTELINDGIVLTDRQTDSRRISTSTTRFADKASMLNPSRGGQITSIANSEALANLLNQNRGKGQTVRTANLLGMFTKDNEIKANIPSNEKSKYAQTKWQFLLDAPFYIGNQCCNVMKKEPAHRYSRQTGRTAITAEMADESRLRTQKWLQNGCNGFDLKIPKSTPMAFWTDQDVLLYIKRNNLPLCSVYGDVVIDYEAEGNLDGQMTMFMDDEDRKYKTTGCRRTGCMLCGFGCHLEKSPNRFEQLKETHPGMYKLLDLAKNNGVTMREAIDWINEHGDMDIRY